MGIVNVTPDSFSDGGQLADGAGGHRARASGSRKKAPTSSTSAAIRRGPAPTPCRSTTSSPACMPVIEGLAGKTRALISIDTRKAEVMRAAAAAGADLDQRRLGADHDPASLEAAAGTRTAGRADARAGRSAHHAGRARLRRRAARRVRLSRSAHRGVRRAAGIPRGEADRRSRHRLRQDARAQSRADVGAVAAARARRAGAARGLAQALHRHS